MEHMVYWLSLLLILLVSISVGIQDIFDSIFELELSTNKKKRIDIYYLIFVLFSCILIFILYFYIIYFINININHISMEGNIFLILITVLLFLLFPFIIAHVWQAGYLLFSKLQVYFVNKVKADLNNDNKNSVV